MDAANRAVGLNPYDMGARGVLGFCYFYCAANIRQAIELDFNGGAARRLRPPISMGGRERVQPLPCRAI